MYIFFQSNGFANDAQKIHSLMTNNYFANRLKSEWLKFIDNK